jgi:recombination protein RecT
MGRDLAQRAAAQNGNGNGNNGDAEGASATLGGQIRKMAPEYAAAMPKGREATQLVRDALTCLRNVRNLDKCEPVSVLGALMTCAQLDLRPGVLGHAWPLPFYDSRSKGYKAQLVIGYQGYIELGHRSGKLRSISPEVVYWEDREFDMWRDENGAHLIHKPALDDVQERIRCFYSAAQLVNGGFQMTRPMSLAMMQAHRDKYAPKNDKGAVVGPWRDHFAAMGRKTMILKNFRDLPKSAEMVTAMEADDGVRVNLDPEANAAEVTERVVVPGNVEPVTPDAVALDDGDPWVVKVAGLGDEHDAANALAELAGLHLDPARAAAIRAAILERYPGAEAA